MDDESIRSLLARLGRPHASGGTVVERAAILAEGTNCAVVLEWIADHGGEPEEQTRSASRRGLHSARSHAGDGAGPRTPQRYVLPPEALA